MNRMPMPLNAERICTSCERGEHRRCCNPNCECLAGASRNHHINRPAKTKENAMSAAITSIDTKTRFGKEPAIAIRKVSELPRRGSGRRSLVDQVHEELDATDLEPGSWYELVVYPDADKGGTKHSPAPQAVNRLRGDERLAAYEFEARGRTVYVSVKA